MTTKYILPSLLFLSILTGCKKFVQVDPPYTLVATTNVFKEASSATAAELGVYQTLSNYTPFNVARRTGAYADELTNYDIGTSFSMPCYTNTLTEAIGNQSWTEFYTVLYTANSVINGLQNSTELNSAVKSQLMGEARFSRAFFLFYLTNLFGDVPMPLSVDYDANAKLARTPSADVYKQILSDLLTADSLLNENYVDGSSITITTDRIRPTKSAAQALLSRVYLYTGNYGKAEAMASAVIAKSDMFTLNTDLNSVFLKNNSEAIWQLENGNTNSFVSQGYNFIITFGISTYGESYSSSISPQLLNAFESNDKRKTNWIGNYTDFTGTTYYYPFKYQQGYTNAPTQNETVLRLAEQYLIRAEARAQQSNTTEAISDLDVIRNRAGLDNYSGLTDKASVITAILHEKQVELFAEWGHRWLDLKRSGTVNTIMTAVTPLKGGSWSDFKALWPIPLSERNKDVNLTQNTGY